MSLPRLLNQPLVVEQWTDGTADPYGNPTPAKAGGYGVSGYLEQTDAAEVQVDRDTFVSNWLLVLPAGSEIDGGDRVLYAGATYEVIGQPLRAWNPRARREDHVEARLRLVTG